MHVADWPVGGNGGKVLLPGFQSGCSWGLLTGCMLQLLLHLLLRSSCIGVQAHAARGGCAPPPARPDRGARTLPAALRCAG